MADLKPGATVWLVPKTLAAPPICFKGVTGTVQNVESDGVYVVVDVPGHGEARVHIDNISRRDPNLPRRRGVQNAGATRTDHWPHGFEEVTLC